MEPIAAIRRQVQQRDGSGDGKHRLPRNRWSLLGLFAIEHS
jgi:hypothetical protein